MFVFTTNLQISTEPLYKLQKKARPPKNPYYAHIWNFSYYRVFLIFCSFSSDIVDSIAKLSSHPKLCSPLMLNILLFLLAERFKILVTSPYMWLEYKLDWFFQLYLGRKFTPWRNSCQREMPTILILCKMTI